jgi:hypothetical protein
VVSRGLGDVYKRQDICFILYYALHSTIKIKKRHKGRF